MGEIDNGEMLLYNSFERSNALDAAIDLGSSDHDLVVQHVAQDDHELYLLDCCLSELLNA